MTSWIGEGKLVSMEIETTKEKSKKLLARFIEELRERERKIKKIKQKIFRKQEEDIEEAD